MPMVHWTPGCMLHRPDASPRFAECAESQDLAYNAEVQTFRADEKVEDSEERAEQQSASECIDANLRGSVLETRDVASYRSMRDCFRPVWLSKIEWVLSQGHML